MFSRLFGTDPEVFVLVVTLDGLRKMRTRLETLPAVVGRDASCEIRIDHPSISASHARFTRAGGSLQVKDLGSAGGTYYKMRRQKAFTVQPGEKFYLGELLCEVEREARAGKTTSQRNADTWVLQPDGSRLGPFALGTLVRMARTGELTPEMELERDGVRLKAGSIEGLTFRKGKQDAPDAGTGEQTLANHHRKGDGERPPPALTCPHCSYAFDLGDVFYVARHPSLRGDAVLGAEAATRFLPTRFDAQGHALDAKDLPCTDLACPRCHLYIPRSCLVPNHMTISMVGAPGSGKTYLLCTLARVLRDLLPGQFGVGFRDADASTNRLLNQYEQTLFYATDQNGLVALPKTQLSGELYNTVKLDGITLELPNPLFFNLDLQPRHPAWEEGVPGQVIVLYDNAGEHFQPGQDEFGLAMTRHLASSFGLIFLFDPTREPKVLQRCGEVEDPQVRQPQAMRQETLLTEMISRVQKLRGDESREQRPLVVLLPKFDIWRGLVPELPLDELLVEDECGVATLDVDLLLSISLELRQLLLEVAPGVVYQAEAFSCEVVYLPASALGTHVVRMANGRLGVKPSLIDPQGVDLPMLYLLWRRGLIAQRLPEPSADDKLVPATWRGDTVEVKPGAQALVLPPLYLGRRLRDLESGRVWTTVVPPHRDLPPPTLGQPGAPDQLKLNKETIIGRDDDCRMILLGDGISRHHARIIPMDGRVYLEDLQSTNGVRLNGVRLARRAELRDGDLVQIQTVLLEFRDPSQGAMVGGRPYAHGGAGRPRKKAKGAPSDADLSRLIEEL